MAESRRVQCSKISLAFGDRDLLKDITLFLATGSRCALAGANGSGKTTLMKIIAGLLKPDSGDVAFTKGCRVSYLPQSVSPRPSGRTLREEAETAFSPLRALLVTMDEIGEKLAHASGAHAEALAVEYHTLQETVEASGYYRREAVIERVLAGLGFSRGDFAKPAGEFSGGWQMRIALARVLLENPDIMLLDEPTNYLDIEARTWLESFLSGFRGGYLLVSHDRYFLDVSVNEVYELFQGSLKRYAGNYSEYEKVREAEIKSLVKRYAEQQEEIARSEELIRRFRYKASKAAMVQERIKKLDKIEQNKIVIPESLKKITIRFPPPPHAGRTALILEGIGKRYGSRPVLEKVDLVLDSGERLVVAGRNGAGKSTLLRIIAGSDSAHSGTVRYGAGIVPAYFSPDNAELDFAGNETTTALEFMEARAPAALIPAIRDMLGAFLFRGDDVHKSVAVLSGGEKSRLSLLGLLLKPANLLVLDEPTNHLDLSSKDLLLDALRAFTGTIVFVSHDRAFMEALSSKTLELSGTGENGASAARLFYGGYGYYLERAASDRADENAPAAGADKKNAADKNDGAAVNSSADKKTAPAPVSAAETRRCSKEKQTLLRRLRKQEQELLAALAALEAEHRRLGEELARPEVYRDGTRARPVKTALDKTLADIETKTAEWECLAAALAEAESAR
ncbi:MAG: ATP-binding cassette domain-containing protein [Treponema sp.]|jgi:ATP-binding cassette subfamily F protein 3|nr:ATP-binding cassette domain-containing protein [Treponema sp.]